VLLHCYAQTGILVGMQKQALAGQLNRMAKLFHLGLPSADELAVCDVFDADLEYPLSLIGEARQQLQSSIDHLLNSLAPVKGTISREFVLRELIPLIREKKVTGEPFHPAEADEFKQKLCDLPLQRYRVLRPIHGVDVAPDSTPVELGDFKIDFGRRLLVSEGDSALLSSVMKPEQQRQLFIQCSVAARETGLASKLADELFYRFELIFRFLIGRRTDWVEVGIINHKGAKMLDQFIYSEDGSPVGPGSSWHGALQPFLLNDPRFPIPTPPLIRLFGLITRSNNDLEKHIVRCAEWTGQALGELNEAAALVKAAIALEVLFSTNEKGVITPSIMAQISESCAFLLGGEDMSPLEVEREVKRLYGIRSSVVHSGKDSVDPNDLDAFIRICRRVVVHLLSDVEFRQIDSVAKLSEHFRVKRYAALQSAQTAGSRS
jgi:hypothetical protein